MAFLDPTVIPGGTAADERGVLTFANEFSMGPVRRFYTVRNHLNHYVRAWHGHMIEEKWFTVVQGAAAVGTFLRDRPQDATKTVLTEKGGVLYVPAGFYNGTKSLTDDTIIMVFSSLSLQESLQDDYRLPVDHIAGFWEIEA